MTEPKKDFALDCGWGCLIFGQTFDQPETLIAQIRGELPERRDIAIYISDPHVLLANAPQEVFLDPSHTYRLDLSQLPEGRAHPGYSIRVLENENDVQELNRIYAARRMVQVPPEFFFTRRDPEAIRYLLAVDDVTGDVIGTVTGVDHAKAFGDPEKGSSLWCLAVDPQARHPGIGDALVRALAKKMKGRGASYMDLSVIYDNEQAIALYDKLGFERVPMFSVKRKNSINETLFTGPDLDTGLNPYATIIAREARRRGIHVEVFDAEGGFLRLSYGGRTVQCRESLSELTSAIAMSICDDKSVTRRIVEAAGVRVPAQMLADDADDASLSTFLGEHGNIVVKPARGEQGRGIAVGLSAMDEVRTAIDEARKVSDVVLLEEMVEGRDLRLVVINYRLVAAAIRKPASIVGDGKRSAGELIEAQSRRRAAATGGESIIPMDGETERVLALSGFGYESVVPEGQEVDVRKTANLHTGGSLHDVTDIVHPDLVEAAITVARAIDIPVVGVDFMVKSPSRPDYAFIEANERPGLANHEPQPTAERFIDLLFPLAIPADIRQVRANQLRQERG